MEAISVKLLSQITDYLSALNCRQLTAMVCEDCYERHDFMPEMWPAFDFLGKEGICSFCFADRPVSSPYINHFLKQECIHENQEEGCWEEPKSLIHDWLLPVGYLQQRREDLRLGECELWTWIQYGVTMRRAVRAADLSVENKEMFDAFFRRAYSAERFSLMSVHEVTDESGSQLPRRSPRPAQSDAKPKQASFLFYKTMFIQLKNWKGGREMRRIEAYYWGLLLALLVWSCGPKDEPMPILPDYISVPASLDKYAGSGLITIAGEGLSIEARGTERLNADTKTYQGVTGEISGEDLTANFTLGQPRPYKERQSVPDQYLANGNLSIMRTVTPGTYRMGFGESPGPRGEITDLTLNLTGPQLYVAKSGTLTIEKSALVKTQGSYSLYRVQGTFKVTMYADGVGIASGQQYPTLTGTFDLLLVRS